MHSFNLTYALMMLAAAGTCAALLRRNQQTLPLSRRQRWAIAAGAFCGAMIGAKLPYVLADWDGLMSGRAWLADGKTILFGIVGGYFGVEIAKWVLEVNVKTGDTFAVPIATAVAIGRLACFHAGCCYGKPTSLPWGVVFATADPPSVARHPTQLYEALFHGLMAVGLWQLERRDAYPHQRLKIYLIVYLGYRFISEWLRPEPILLGELTGYQWAVLPLIGLFILLWRRDANQLRRSEVPMIAG